MKLLSSGLKAGLCVLLLSLLFLINCGSVATKKGFYDGITTELRGNNFEVAVQQIETARQNNKYGKKDRFLYYLDAGLANHYASHLIVSNEKLTKAEDAAEELFTKSISRAAVSVLLNDNALEYSGEDYEILYTNLIMALNYAAKGSFDDAFVEIRRANEKLDLLELKYRKAAEQLQEGSDRDTANVGIKYKAEKVRFNNNAFARYLSMHMYAADGLMDDARIDYDLLRRAFQEQPHIYYFDPPDVKYNSPDKAILSVVGLAGLSPVKEALNLRLRTDKDLNLVQVLYTDGRKKDPEYGHLPIPVNVDFYLKFSIPQITSQPMSVNRIRVLANSKPVGELELLEDVAAVAKETFRAKKSLIYLRTVARVIFKGIASYKLKKKADTGGLGGWLKKAAIDVATDISENADLRCSHLLPGKIYIGDFEIQPGEYDLTIEFFDSSGTVIDSKTIIGFRVEKDDFNLVEAFSFK